MKNRIISALLCICLIASVFTLAVSAVEPTTPSKGTYTIKKVSKEAELTSGTGADDISSSDPFIKVLNADGDAVTTTEFAKNFRIGYEITGEAPTEILKIKFTEKTANIGVASATPSYQRVYILEGNSASEALTYVGDGDSTPGYYYLTLPIKRVKSLCSITTGAVAYSSSKENDHHWGGKYGSGDFYSYNLDSYNIAYVEILNTTPDKVFTNTVSRVNKAYDLVSGETITLTAKLKSEYAGYYDFAGWISGPDSTTIISEEPVYSFTVTGAHEFFAVFREIKSRCIINIKCNDGGKIIHQESFMDFIEEDKSQKSVTQNGNFTMFDGNGEVSVFEGSSPCFMFVPDGLDTESKADDYYVQKVIADGVEISGIRNLLSIFGQGDITAAIKAFGVFTNATNKDVYAYQFKNISLKNADSDEPIVHTLEVVFAKQTIFEPASGVSYVPGPELSTGATEAAEADGDAAAQATTLPAEGNKADGALADVANPATGSTSAAIAAFATLSLAAAAAFVSYKKKES